MRILPLRLPIVLTEILTRNLALYSTIPLTIYWVLIGGSYSILDFYQLCQFSRRSLVYLTISVGYVSGFALSILLLRKSSISKNSKGNENRGYIDHSKMLGVFVALL